MIRVQKFTYFDLKFSPNSPIDCLSIGILHDSVMMTGHQQLKLPEASGKMPRWANNKSYETYFK